MSYRLTRELPDGTVKAHSMPFARVRDAQQAAACVLADNGAATRAEAARFAGTITPDTPCTFAGYTFTITDGEMFTVWGWKPRLDAPIKLNSGSEQFCEARRGECEADGWQCAMYRAVAAPLGFRIMAARQIEAARRA